MARSHHEWPFFDATHRAFAEDVDAWCRAEDRRVHGPDIGAHCRALVASLGQAGLLRRALRPSEGAGIDVRAACLGRERLARESGLADFAFAMQGLGTGPVLLFGDKRLVQSHAEPALAGKLVSAFAISEAEAGSDIGAMTMSARRDGPDWVLDGEKTWISNAGIADFYVVFARSGEGPGTKGISAFVVDAATPGLTSTPVDVAAPHPLGTLRFAGCRVRDERRVGEAGRGVGVALGTLDVFRSTVGAAALGFARRALDEALLHVQSRSVFGSSLGDYQLTQARLADMATTIDASALLVYRAAWTRDTTGGRVTREAAMAKLFATEGAQKVVDDAVQLLGARGVVAGSVVEELYREVRPLRIYEGTTEIQKLVIARSLLEDGAAS